jgi:flagellar basal body-associated protein FliL
MLRPLAFSVLLALAVATPAYAGEKPAEHGAEKEKKKDKKPAVHKITQSESYVMIDPIYTSIMDGNRPLGLLMLGIGLDIPNAELRQRADRDMPQLRDAYVRNLMAFCTSSVRPWAQPDVEQIADRLQRVTDRVLHQKGAKVLLAQMAMRMNK